jgi:alpha-D-ribose 1-methylphosphonate 5-triphosphate synthase subunit PhnI
MGYVAARGGVEAIEHARHLVRYFRLRGGSVPLEVKQIQDQFRLAVDKVMGEGSLYSPFHAALALKQTEGDGAEASLMLRAFASTCPRTAVSCVADSGEMHVIRRISAAFQEVPGGQLLGPSRDYSQRLFDFTLVEEREAEVHAFLAEYAPAVLPDPRRALPRFPKVLDMLRAEGLLAPLPPRPADGDVPADVTRRALVFPAPRSARLQTLARGETGGLLALAYSSMRGFGDVHPTIGDLRVGWVPVRIPHPHHHAAVLVGRVLVTEAEVVARFGAADGNGGAPMFTVGYGLCFGHNELKAICIAVLDRALNEPEARAPAENEEFVLAHIDPGEASGFALHYKLPHYVTFQSEIDRLRAAQRQAEHREAARDAGA